jgi:hypothetical protein
VSATEKKRIAWQPLTPRGVAAFAGASFDQFHIYQLVVAVYCAGTLAVFLWMDWSPVILGAAQKMPETARMDAGTLGGIATPVVSENHFLSVAVNPAGGDAGQTGDVQISFGKTSADLCAFRSEVGEYQFGCVSLSYPLDATGVMGRTKLEPWWGAWRGMILAGVGFAMFLVLLLCWVVLALVYMLPVRILAFVLRRQITWTGSCRMAGAALMPGAILMGLGIWAYGFFLIDIVRFALIFGLHLIVPWFYMAAATLTLDKITPVPGENKAAATVATSLKDQGKKNPFSGG